MWAIKLSQNNPTIQDICVVTTKRCCREHEPWQMNWMMTGGAALLNQVYHLFRSMMAMTMAGDGENRHQRRYVSRVVPES